MKFILPTANDINFQNLNLMVIVNIQEKETKVEFTYIIIKSRVVDPNKGGFLDIPSHMVPLPPYYLALSHWQRVSSPRQVISKPPQ